MKRSFFGFFIVSAVFGAMLYASPGLERDLRVYASTATEHHDFTLPSFAEIAAVIPAVQSVSARSLTLIDMHYVSANQPGQHWRDTVDAYRHIDPGRLMI